MLREGLLVQGCCGTVSFVPLAASGCHVPQGASPFQFQDETSVCCALFPAGWHSHGRWLQVSCASGSCGLCSPLPVGPSESN